MKFRWHNAKKNCVETSEDGKVFCKDCAHLCYEDIGVYYCDKRIITGQLYPDDYCSRAMKKKEENKK